MKVLITGRHGAVTDAVRDYAQAKVTKLARFFDRATTARVTMDVDHNDHLVEIVIDVTRGVTLVGKASAPDMYAALDLAEQKLAPQLRRHKQRLSNHHRGERRPAIDPSAPAPAAIRRGGSDVDSGEREMTYEEVIDRMRRGD